MTSPGSGMVQSLRPFHKIIELVRWIGMEKAADQAELGGRCAAGNWKEDRERQDAVVAVRLEDENGAEQGKTWQSQHGADSSRN